MPLSTMTILWIYDMPLIPEAGGTERITSLVSKGLTECGHTCMGILQFRENSEKMLYGTEQVMDLYKFLMENHVDIVINQIAYSKWLLSDFLIRGGSQWHEEGGKIISCLHFDPCNPSYIQLLKSSEHLNIRQRILILRHYLLQPYYRRKKQREEGAVYNFIYDNSDRMVVLSSSHFGYLKSVMRRSEYSKLDSIGNPLTFSDIADPKIIDSKSKTAIVCARMSEYHKRISIILKAWKLTKKHHAAKDWKLVIIGEGPDLDRYKRFVAEKHIEEVFFLGQQSPAAYYEKASILLLASSAEGWGLTITEGLQYGVVPVVMDSSSVYREIIEPLYNGILTPNDDLKAFSKAIRKLMDTPERLHAMQRNALVSAHRFTLDKAIGKWNKLLASI